VSETGAIAENSKEETHGEQSAQPATGTGAPWSRSTTDGSHRSASEVEERMARGGGENRRRRASGSRRTSDPFRRAVFDGAEVVSESDDPPRQFSVPLGPKVSARKPPPPTKGQEPPPAPWKVVLAGRS